MSEELVWQLNALCIDPSIQRVQENSSGIGEAWPAYDSLYICLPLSLRQPSSEETVKVLTSP